MRILHWMPFNGGLMMLLPASRSFLKLAYPRTVHKLLTVLTTVLPVIWVYLVECLRCKVSREQAILPLEFFFHLAMMMMMRLYLCRYRYRYRYRFVLRQEGCRLGHHVANTWYDWHTLSSGRGQLNLATTRHSRAISLQPKYTNQLAIMCNNLARSLLVLVASLS